MENNLNIDLNPKDTIEALENAIDSKHNEVSQLGKATARVGITLVETIETCLLPLVVINSTRKKAIEYFQNKFTQDMQKKIEQIEPENLIEPKNYIAEPAMVNLCNVLDELDLKNMYLNLLKSSMDKKNTDIIHPAFVEIIKQITPEEAKLLKFVLKRDNFPIVCIQSISYKGYEKCYENLYENLLDISEGKEFYQNSNLPKYIDNWIRLGLVSVTYNTYLVDNETLYQNFENRPEYIDIKQKNPYCRLYIQKGVLIQTQFGRDFIKIVTD